MEASPPSFATQQEHGLALAQLSTHAESCCAQSVEVEGLPPQWVPWAKGTEEEFSATISRMRVSMQVGVQALQLPG